MLTCSGNTSWTLLAITTSDTTSLPGLDSVFPHVGFEQLLTVLILAKLAERSIEWNPDHSQHGLIIIGRLANVGCVRGDSLKRSVWSHDWCDWWSMILLLWIELPNEVQWFCGCRFHDFMIQRRWIEQTRKKRESGSLQIPNLQVSSVVVPKESRLLVIRQDDCTFWGKWIVVHWPSPLRRAFVHWPSVYSQHSDTIWESARIGSNRWNEKLKSLSTSWRTHSTSYR